MSCNASYEPSVTIDSVPSECTFKKGNTQYMVMNNIIFCMKNLLEGSYKLSRLIIQPTEKWEGWMDRGEAGFCEMWLPTFSQTNWCLQLHEIPPNESCLPRIQRAAQKVAIVKMSAQIKWSSHGSPTIFLPQVSPTTAPNASYGAPCS